MRTLIPGQALSHLLTAQLRKQPGVTPILDGDGLTYADHFFAFVASDGHLMVKLSGERATHFISCGKATPVDLPNPDESGWVSLPIPSGRTHDWQIAITEALCPAVDPPPIDTPIKEAPSVATHVVATTTHAMTADLPQAV